MVKELCTAQQREEESRYQDLATETSHWTGFVNFTSFRTARISHLREVLVLHPKSEPKLPAQGISHTLLLGTRIRQCGSSLQISHFHVTCPHMLRNNETDLLHVFHAVSLQILQVGSIVERIGMLICPTNFPRFQW